MSDNGNRQCLVVGGNGFIGSHIVDHLAVRGYKVVAFDRFTDGPKFRESPNVEILKGDIMFEPDLISALEGIDYVFYSFSATTPYTSENDPYSDIELNLKHCVSFFSACVDKGVKKIVYLSSGGAIYGTTAEQKKAAETDLPLPVSPYGICKLAIENYLAYFNKKFGLPYLVFRIANPYGPRQSLKHNQGVIPAFIERLKRGEEITIYGDGGSSRDYLYVEDAVVMLLNVFEAESKYNLYNIGSGVQTTLNDLLQAFGATFGKAIDAQYLDAPKTFLSSSNISVERYNTEFGVYGLTDIKTGLSKTLEDTN